MYGFLDEIVADNMTRAVKTVSPDTTMQALNARFAKDDFNAYPVMLQGKLIGIVSKFDFLNCFILTKAALVPRYDELMDRTVERVMSRTFVSVRPDTRLQRVLQLMVGHRIRSMPVLDSSDCLVGVISREDVMRALRRCATPRSVDS